MKIIDVVVCQPIYLPFLNRHLFAKTFYLFFCFTLRIPHFFVVDVDSNVWTPIELFDWVWFDCFHVVSWDLAVGDGRQYSAFATTSIIASGVCLMPVYYVSACKSSNVANACANIVETRFRTKERKKNHSKKLRTAGNPEWNKNSTLKTFPMLFCCSCRSCFQLHTIFRRVLVCRIRCLFEGGLDPKNSEKIQIPKSFPLSLWWVFVCANAFFNQFQCYFANA